ncbi:MAG TPA: hypothetical protein VFT22_07475 [Kofleriaceae bacterium]|nr:hypothetical protein [Kofleriaceae bacterium]
MTTTKAAKVTKVTELRNEAASHGDTETVRLCDAALAGDAEALASVEQIMRDAKANARSSRAPRRRRSAWAVPAPRTTGHSWAHDEE